MAEQNKRNLTVMLILGVVTLGIYWWYWIYKMTELSNKVTNLPQRSPVGQMLLCIFIPFYEIYWYYQTSKRVDVMEASIGKSTNNGVLSLLLMFFAGLPIAALVMQNNVNQVLEVKTGNDNGVSKSIGGPLALGIAILALAVIGSAVASWAITGLVESDAFENGIQSGIDWVLENSDEDFDAELSEEVLEDSESVRQTEDGKWALMDGDEVDKEFTGIAGNENGEWYIEDGYVNFEFSGTLESDGMQYVVEKGKVVSETAIEE